MRPHERIPLHGHTGPNDGGRLTGSAVVTVVSGDTGGTSGGGSSSVPVASEVAITDSGAYYTGTDVEAALAEVGLALAGAMSNPMTTQDDIIVGGASGVPARLAKGTDGQVLTVDPTTHHLVWATPTAGSGDVATDTIWDAKGDLAGGTGSNTAARLAVGSNGQVLTADSGETTGMKWATPSSGGLVYPIDNRTLHATYGDHFTGASLDAKWTRRNYTSGAESYQQGVAATWLRISASGRANGDGYFQTAPAGDFQLEMRYIPRYMGAQYPNLGPCIIDSSGNGVSVIIYNGPPIAVLVVKISTYSSYASSYVQAGGAADNIQQLGATIGSERPLWLRLRKSSNNYYCNYSFDGEIWGLESSALAYTFTVNRIGFMNGPLGNANVDTTIPTRYDVDWFDLV